MFSIVYNKQNISNNKANLTAIAVRLVLPFLLFGFCLLVLSSCSDNKNFIENLRTPQKTSTPIFEKPTEILQDKIETSTHNNDSDYDVSDLRIYFDNLTSNDTSPIIRVEGLEETSTLELLEGSCQGELLSNLNQDGVFEGFTPIDEYQDRIFYIRLTYQGKTSCKELEDHWVHLQPASISLNETQTNLDKRYPKFDISNLFLDKEVQVSLHEDILCSSNAVSQIVTTNSEDTILGVNQSLSDILSHTYYVKQSYRGVSSCSLGVSYSYSIELENLVLSYDDILFGTTPSGVSVSKVLPNSTVSLHKGSCLNEADSLITEDGTLTPLISNSYTEEALYIKYSFEDLSECSGLDSKYLYLEQPLISLNNEETSSHKRRPSFDITNLFTGKNVAVSLYENSTCSGVAVSDTIQTDTGSTTITISSDLEDSNTHSYYVKQTYLGHSSCSSPVEYTYGLNISDLTITSDPILYGSTPSSINISGMIEGSNVSIHKGSCNAAADDSINEDGSLTPLPVNTYIKSDIYLKYTLGISSTCSLIGVKYINLENPLLSLNSEQTNLDKRSPKFNATNLFTGKEVSLSLHSDSSCLSASLSNPLSSTTGSSVIGLSSNLVDTSTHSYYLKQSYLGVSSCSSVLNYKYDILVSNLILNYDPLIDGSSPSNIRVSKILSGSNVSIHKGSCLSSPDDSISSDGTVNLSSVNIYTETDIYLKYTLLQESDCIKLDTNYIRLLPPTISLNEVQTNLDKRLPKFNITNLFTGKEVSVSLYESSTCSENPVSNIVNTSTGSTVIGISEALTDTNTHTYYVKQSYGGVSSCSSGINYIYELDTDSLSLSYDEILYGNSPSSVTVSHMLTGSTVSLHKGSCLSSPDDSITEDSSLTPLSSNSYEESDLFIKYSFEESSDCKSISSKYLNLLPATLSLNVAQTSLHKRTPTFNITNLFTGKNVTVALYENSSCSGVAVSEEVQTDSGSTSLTLSSDINDNNTHSYYVKQTYLEHSTCSSSVEYTYGLNISDLTINADPILYGSTPSSISVSGMISESTVSIHKNSCNSEADDSINADGTLTPIAVNTYTESEIYLKYSLNGASSCDSIGVIYLNLDEPVLSLNSSQTNLDKRSPKFNVTNLFTGKEVNLTLHESSDCSGIPVSTTLNSDTGSSLISPSSNISDLNSHSYSVKQSYSGYSTCSNVVAYQYEIDVDNLTVVADELLYGSTPGSITVSKMISGSTVSLHKESCLSVADDSINTDGTLTPTSTGSYNYSTLYIKYTKSESSDCKPIDSHYLYLEKPTLSINSTQTDLHPLTPSFNITNLFTGQNVSVELYEDSSCSQNPVSISTTTTSGSTTLTLSSSLSDSDSHNYYVKQSYLGQSSCSLAQSYQFSADTSDLTLTYDPVLYGSNPSGVTVSGMVTGSSLSLYKETNCLGVADSTINEDGIIYPTATNSYTESDIYIKYSFDDSSSCTKLDTSYIYLEAPTITLTTPLLDPRIPTYNVTNLFNTKSVTTTLHESSDCSGAAVSTSVVSSTGSSSVTRSSALTDINSHTYSVKQSYGGVSSCSNSTSYQYSIDVDNLEISADSVLYGSVPGSISVSKILSGATVSLHKGSCLTVADDSINTDGTLTPTSTGSYNYSELYIKYTKSESSDCKPIDSHYLYLEQPNLSLNSSQTDLHPLTPTFDVTNLFTGQNVSVELYEDSSCSSSAVSTPSTTSLGSTTLSLSSAINDGLIHTYYVKQSYLGQSTCSSGVNYSLPVDTQDLTITTSITNGVLNASVSGGYVGSSISLHKGTCNAALSDSATFTAVDQQLDLSVSTNSYSYQDVYLKYAMNDSNDCVLLDKKLTYLASPTLALVSPLSDKRVPEFNISGLYSSQTVTVEVYESSNCTGSAVTGTSTINTGSKTLTKSSALTDISSHTYSAKQTFNGISSCSNSVSYNYPLNVNNLTVSVSSILYGSTPGSVSVSGILSGSTVSLHKGSCLAAADDSINADGNLTPAVTGSYQDEDLYLKYSFDLSSDCQAISSKYLYLEQPTVTLDSVQTSLHKTTPTFTVTNLFSGKSVTVTLHGRSDCADSSLSSSVVSNTGSASLTLSSAITSNGGYSYYVKQSYLGYSSCSDEIFYIYRDNPIIYLTTIYEFNKHFLSYSRNKNKGIVIRNTEFNNKVKVYEGTSCSNEENLLTTVTTVKDTTLVPIPTMEDGIHRFSFQEQTPTSKNLGCYTTSSINIKNSKLFGTDNRFAYINGNTLYFYGQFDYSKTFTSDKAPTQVFTTNLSGASAFAVLHKDGSISAWGAGENAGEDISSVQSSLDGTIPVRQVYTTGSAFAALRSDGSVITWGNSTNGGNSSSVTSSISSGVVSITTTGYAFAASKSDGSVVTWGNSNYGGDSSSVASSLSSDVIDIVGNNRAFAALRSDGSVITWGGSTYGGNSSSVTSSISSGVVKVYANTYGFVALKSDGSAVTWGNSTYGGDSSSVSSSLSSGVVRIFYTPRAYAALKSDGSVVTWGDTSYGGDSSSVSSSLSSGVTAIYTNHTVFIAVKSDGSLVAWGQNAYGADISGVEASLSGNVVRIYSNVRAFAALKTDGSVVAWGSSQYGGSLDTAASSLDGTIRVVDILPGQYSFIALREDNSIVTWGNLINHSSYHQAGYASTDKIYSNNFSMAILKANGSVKTWGAFSYGGWPSTSIQNKISSGVTNIFTNDYAYAALKSNGSLIVWGDADYGGDSSSVKSLVSSGVTSVASNSAAFAAIKSDGSVVTWGDSSYGGDSSSVATELSSGVVSISATQRAFAAIKSDGSVVTWGTSTYGGDSSSVATGLSSGVVSISATQRAFAATKSDGSVVTWGTSSYGGDSSSVATGLLSGVVSITAAQRAFAALKSDGSVVTWGGSSYGGNSSSVATKLTSGVVSIYSSLGAFLAIKTDGSVVSWGNSTYGGSVSSSIASKIKSKGISKILSNTYAFVVLLSDNSVVTWGNSSYGGNSSAVSSQLASGVDDIFVSDKAGYAVKSGALISWGTPPPDLNLLDPEYTNGTCPISKIYSTKNYMMIIHTDNTISYIE